LHCGRLAGFELGLGHHYHHDYGDQGGCYQPRASQLDRRIMNTERELAIDELDVVTGGGTDGGNVVGGWNTSSSSGPSGDATIMTTEGYSQNPNSWRGSPIWAPAHFQARLPTSASLLPKRPESGERSSSSPALNPTDARTPAENSVNPVPRMAGARPYRRGD
jgi:hypothetical protein